MEAQLPNGQPGYEAWAKQNPRPPAEQGYGILHSIREERTSDEYGMFNMPLTWEGYAVCLTPSGKLLITSLIILI